MDKLLVLFASVCCLVLVTSATDLSIHDYDVQIHPIHGHYGDHHGYATSIRYDKRYHHKAPEYHQDVVYQYVADGYDEDDGEEHLHGYY